ncbi:hypothetical protein BDW02DRAFT_557787 [Decorospora gaudefroyi]|uniref:Cryptic loci regulator 2 N-terminal domain-containing protein n=1 Tax=Decorospora gaudefroyi TaxID=184978 RepID=A0A6A5K1W6_9PLEO|nr:hypothetical protein BDW02DRAFT_557787 [Decorospora gaudefroyi]
MALQPMTQFWPVFATKSDGQHIVNIRNKPLRNGPTEEQLNMAPNDQGQRDFYREIKKEDPKHMDWRKKLGGMLLRELGGKPYEDKWQQCILWELPENYKLFEHIKTKADGQLKTVKNHSGGGHDRQDAYLYGYPKGPKKRFRSPVEFFPHLLWLCTDDSSDYANCTCKMCSPAGDVEKPQVKAEFKLEQPSAMKRESSSSGPVAANNIVGRNPTVYIPFQQPASGPPAPSPSTKPATPIPRPQPTPNAQQTRPPSVLQSSPLPQPRSLEQQADLTYDRFLCRTGEVVWFLRPSMTAWGLGLVVRRWTAKEYPNQRSYLIQPLSHPFESPPQELVHSNDHVKPWLAWSPPPPTFLFLQQNPQYGYENTDWQGLISGQYGDDGTASVDASILAAKAIESTYTLFERLKTSRDDKGNELRHFNGLYLGTEKLWRGDIVRLHMHIGTGRDLMVVTDIVEQVFANPPQDQPRTKVIISGDIYTYATLDTPNPNSLPTLPQQNNNIPTRMVKDMAWRNRTLIPMTGQLGWWQLLHPNFRLDVADIQGRWYEMSILFAKDFTEDVKTKKDGNIIPMNSRCGAPSPTKYPGIPHPDRISAFGSSIPNGTRLIDTLEPPSQEQMGQPPPRPQHDAMDGGMGAAMASFSLDEFMNLGPDGAMEYGPSPGDFTF